MNNKDDLPSVVWYYDNGNIKREIWKYGRGFGPSIISYNKDGSVEFEAYFYWDNRKVSVEEYDRFKAILDFEKDLEESIPVNSSLSKVVKF